MTHPKIIIALDFDDIKPARKLVEKLSPELCRLKIGKHMFVQYGPAWVEELMKQGFDIFLDLKFHDIPSTVAKACISASKLGVWMCNVHISGGMNMLQSARQALDALPQKPLLIGVTLLTSVQATDLALLGMIDSIEAMVLKLAHLAKEAGLDGVVCSAQDAPMLRTQLGTQFLLVTPGIRMPTDASHDQKRIMTPQAAISSGADYLVIGRPVTQARDPLALLNVLQHLSI